MMRVAISLIVAAFVATGAAAQSPSMDRGALLYFQYMSGKVKLENLTAAERADLFFYYSAIKAREEEEGGPEFEVVASIRGCKYFVVEQGVNYSLIDEWSCSHPTKGDTGRGNINSYGTKSVKLDGLSCTVFVDDWLLSKSRAQDKLLDKCG
jgi:hypothetical protein